MSTKDETRARRVPRGPEEWGKVLYEPEWVFQRRHREGYVVYVGYSLVVFFLALGILFLVLLWGGPEAFVLFGSLMMLVAFGASLSIVSYKTMPFRVYEAGFTKYVVPLSRGLRGEEVLVPREAIRRVEIDSVTMENNLSRRIKITYLDGGREEELLVSPEQTEDPMGALVALDTIAHDGMDEAFYDFIGGDDPVVEMDGAFATILGPMRQILWLFVGMGFFMAIAIGAVMAGSEAETTAGLLFVGAMMSGAAAFTLVMANAFGLAAVGHLVNASTLLVGDRIHVPEPATNRLVLRVRSTVPLEEVVEVRRALYPGSLHHVGRLRLTNGETWSVPYQVFEGLSGRPGFERVGLAMVNRRVGDARGPPLAQLSMVKGVAWGLSLVLLTIATTVAVTLYQGENPLAWLGSDGGLLAVQVVFGICMGLAFILYYRREVRNATMVKDMMVMERGIAMPNAPERWRFVPKEAVRGCCVEGTFWGNRIQLATDHGKLSLPLAAHEALTRGGMAVDDSDGVLPKVRKGPPHHRDDK